MRDSGRNKLLVPVLLVLMTMFSVAQATFAATARDEVLKQQRNYFDLILAKKFDDLDKILAPEYVGVYRLGIINRAKESADLREFPLAEYKITDEHFISLDSKTAVLDVHLHVRVTVGGKDFFEDDNLSCVWRKAGKRWLLVSQAAVKTDAADK